VEECRALVPSRLLSVSTPDLWMLAGSRPDISRALVLGLARRSAHVRRRAAVLRTLAVAERVLAVLHELAERFGRTGSNTGAIPLPLTQDLLASMCGASRESVNRALATLRRDGAIGRAGAVYVVSARACSVASSNASVPLRVLRETIPSRSSLSR